MICNPNHLKSRETLTMQHLTIVFALIGSLACVVKSDEQLYSSHPITFDLGVGGELECLCKFSNTDHIEDSSTMEKVHTRDADTLDEIIKDGKTPEGATQGLSEHPAHSCFEICQHHDCDYSYRDGDWKQWFSCLVKCKNTCFKDDVAFEITPKRELNSFGYEDSITSVLSPKQDQSSINDTELPDPVIVQDDGSFPSSLRTDAAIDSKASEYKSFDKRKDDSNDAEEKTTTTTPESPEIHPFPKRNAKAEDGSLLKNNLSSEDVDKIIKVLKEGATPRAGFNKNKDITIDLDIIPLREGS